jgi:hypothetical protein
MIKRIFSYIMLFAVTVPFIVSCSNDDDDEIESYSSKIIIDDTWIDTDDDAIYNYVMKFSTDGGTTWVDYPVIEIGQKYMVKIFNKDSEVDLPIRNFDFDWSASTPKPADVHSKTPEFTMAKDNSLLVTLADAACDYDASFWAGTYSALEDYGEDGTYGPYDVELVQDETDPNKFWLDNFWDSGIEAYIVFDGAGNASFPDQVADGENISGSAGTVTNECHGVMNIDVTYAGYTWNYQFERVE